MAEDTDVWPGAIEKIPPLFGQLSGFKHHMPDRDAEAIQLDDRLYRETALFVVIDIA